MSLYARFDPLYSFCGGESTNTREQSPRAVFGNHQYLSWTDAPVLKLRTSLTKARARVWEHPHSKIPSQQVCHVKVASNGKCRHILSCLHSVQRLEMNVTRLLPYHKTRGMRLSTDVLLAQTIREGVRIEVVLHKSKMPSFGPLWCHISSFWSSNPAAQEAQCSPE